MARCLVGYGSNVGKRRDFLDQALELLRFMPGVSLVGVSRYRETRPIGGPPGQGFVLNGACLLETELPPHDVLGMLAAVENTLHRERDERWGPRTIDLDLLLYDDCILETATLTLPHPRMATRRFVLEPCAEIAPDAVHPLAGCTLAALLESISVPHPHVAVIGVPGTGGPEIAAAIADATLARLVHLPAEDACVGRLRQRVDAATMEQPWLQAVEACSQPLLTRDWPQDPQSTVADYWLHSLRLAAALSLNPEPLARFEVGFTRIAAKTVPPDVAILLVASPESIDAQLRQLQDRIIQAVRQPQPGAACGPRAVVTIAADNLGQALLEAVAAVEAMA